jgi:hypothetical protein
MISSKMRAKEMFGGGGGGGAKNPEFYGGEILLKKNF